MEKMSKKYIELEKAFVLDTIRKTPLSRTQVLVHLKRAEHIGASTLRLISHLAPEASAPALDFFANFPASTQGEIVKHMATSSCDLHTAITAITGEILLDGSVYLAELVAAWEAAPEGIRSRFLKGIKNED